ncbi:hypothetical protein RB195_025080 [Necator americanus]|uniref:Uncharacterized protein n=1 Tax=Necator americanus TaxID=51031 RepID=A0ABR1EQS4_NECAM
MGYGGLSGIENPVAEHPNPLYFSASQQNEEICWVGIMSRTAARVSSSSQENEDCVAPQARQPSRRSDAVDDTEKILFSLPYISGDHEQSGTELSAKTRISERRDGVEIPPANLKCHLIMQESTMASAISHYSEDPFFGNKDLLTPQSARKKSIANSVSSNPSSGRGSDPCEKRVTFQEKNSGTKGRLIEGVKFLYERSSPIEEWSSDSRDSPLLEMSRYDNVPPCEHKDRLVSDP